jgi:hypothetical protein
VTKRKEKELLLSSFLLLTKRNKRNSFFDQTEVASESEAISKSLEFDQKKH